MDKQQKEQAEKLKELSKKPFSEEIKKSIQDKQRYVNNKPIKK